MIGLRKYGDPPFKIVLIHGGPGAPGEMAPVARELSLKFSVLEPFQSADTINGQLNELKDLLEKNCSLPVILIGWSWRAWLSYIFASKFQEMVKKLILIGSGPF